MKMQLGNHNKIACCFIAIHSGYFRTLPVNGEAILLLPLYTSRGKNLMIGERTILPLGIKKVIKLFIILILLF
jgi:hypothetical protein